jgi:hypothetical protein
VNIITILAHLLQALGTFLFSIHGVCRVGRRLNVHLILAGREFGINFDLFFLAELGKICLEHIAIQTAILHRPSILACIQFWRAIGFVLVG